MRVLTAPPPPWPRLRPGRVRPRGLALPVGLILLLLATITTLAAMRGTVIQERMSGNQHLKALSQMAAEAGAAAFAEWALDNGNAFASTLWTSAVKVGATQADAVNVATARHHYYIETFPAGLAAPPDCAVNSDANATNDSDVCLVTDVATGRLTLVAKVTGIARAGNAPTAREQARTQVEVRVSNSSSTTTTLNPAFGFGMLSDNDIDIRGSTEINGFVHANGSVSTNGNSTLTGGAITAMGTAAIRNNSTGDPNAVLGGQAEKAVPRIETVLLDQLRSLASTVQSGSCNFSPSGDGGGAIYFCDGNATVSGTHFNVTIVATGSVTYRGAGERGNPSDPIRTAVIAQGDITFNGSSETYATLWTNGTLTQNGNARIVGSVVAQGNIRLNGGPFVGNSDLGNAHLPGTSTVLNTRLLERWAEVVPRS